MHASHTSVGHKFDTNPIAFIAFTVYQAIMQKLGATSQILLSMSDSPSEDGRTIAEKFAYMPLNYQPGDWISNMLAWQETYPRDYTKTFGAMWVLISALCLPWWVVEWYMPIVFEVLSMKAGKIKTWLFDEYMPEVKLLAEKNAIPWHQAIPIMIKFSGVILKIMWAFVW